jgi:PAS domain S-box-containing protein
LTNNTFKVFLCSTYSDLLNEREAVLRVIQRLQLLHTSMEFFGARPETPLETILDEVRGSDIVIVIIGHRYGTFVPGKRFSYTEIEYREAWRSKKPCLVYIRSDDVPILPSYIEKDPVGINALEKFKKLLRSRHLIASYRQAEDLSVHVAVDIERIVKGAKKVIPVESTDSSLSILDFLNTPSFFCDMDNRIIKTNSTLVKVLGYSEVEMIGKNLIDFVYITNDYHSVANGISYYIDQGYRNIELLFKKKDGDSIFFKLDIIKYELFGESVIQYVAHDITGQKKTEEALKEAEARLREYSELVEELTKERETLQVPHDVLEQAQKAYTAYMDATRAVSRIYRENEEYVDAAYEKAINNANDEFNKLISQALMSLKETLRKAPLVYRQAIDTYEDNYKQALTTHNDAVNKSWLTRLETMKQAWDIYSKVVR